MKEISLLWLIPMVLIAIEFELEYKGNERENKNERERNEKRDCRNARINYVPRDRKACNLLEVKVITTKRLADISDDVEKSTVSQRMFIKQSERCSVSY